MVAVAGTPGRPVVLARRRIETADTAIPGSRQPYHAAERLGVDRADTLIRQCRDSSMRLAEGAVSAMVAELEQRGVKVVGAGILFASGRVLPDLASILRSHALIHTAEGEFFRDSGSSERAVSLRVTSKRAHLGQRHGAAPALGRGSAVTDWRPRPIVGPPWR